MSLLSSYSFHGLLRLSATTQWDTRFYAGASNSAGANATWFVTQRDTMVANNAQIKGTITGSNISGTSISASTISGGTINVGGIVISSGRTGDIRWNGSATCYINMADGIMSIYHGNQINIATVGTGGVHIGGRCYLPSLTYLNARPIKTYDSGGRTYVILG